MDIMPIGPNGWQNTEKCIKDKNQYLFDTKILSDCRFVVGFQPNEQIIKAHKLILASSSPIFESLFYRELTGNETVTIRDVQPDVFNILLEYIYTDKFCVKSFDQALSLCYIANKYIIMSLYKKCKSYFSSNLTSKNACKVYELTERLDEEALKSKCLAFICENTLEVLNSRSFLGAEINTVITIFEQELLNINSDFELFSALQRYVSENYLDSEQERCGKSTNWLMIRSSLMKIRFLTLTPRQFAEGPAISDLLDKDEKLSIMMNISSPNSMIPMPNGFSVKRSRPNTSQNDLFNFPCWQQNYEIINDFESSQYSTFVYRFSSFKNIRIHGIKVPTQKQIKDPFVSYRESITIRIRNIRNGPLLEHDDISKEKYNSIKEIEFHSPVFIREKEEHQIDIILKGEQGTYPGLHLIEAMFRYGVRLQLEKNQSVGFIRTILFSFP